MSRNALSILVLTLMQAPCLLWASSSSSSSSQPRPAQQKLVLQSLDTGTGGDTLSMGEPAAQRIALQSFEARMVARSAITPSGCESVYESCCDTCRSMPDPRLRVVCWGACMAAYATCIAVAD